jgi:hypothetical protein
VPDHITQWCAKNKKFKDYQFLGLKKYAYYHDEEMIHPIGEPKVEAKPLDIFLIALELIQLKIAEEKDLEDGNYTLYYLVPGDEAEDVMTKLKGLLLKAFPNLTNDRIVFIREPRAAAAYTVSTILSKNLSNQTAPGN